MSSSQLTFIFFWGVETSNQPWFSIFNRCLKPWSSAGGISGRIFLHQLFRMISITVSGTRDFPLRKHPFQKPSGHLGGCNPISLTSHKLPYDSMIKIPGLVNVYICLHDELELDPPNFIAGYINYFDWVIFNSKLFVYQAGYTNLFMRSPLIWAEPASSRTDRRAKSSFPRYHSAQPAGSIAVSHHDTLSERRTHRRRVRLRVRLRRSDVDAWVFF